MHASWFINNLDLMSSYSKRNTKLETTVKRCKRPALFSTSSGTKRWENLPSGERQRPMRAPRRDKSRKETPVTPTSPALPTHCSSALMLVPT